jgi:transposase
MGYKQLYEIERVFRDLKHVIDIRPINHRLPERIKSHVLLCWLAENEVDQTWFQMKKKLFSIKLGISIIANKPINELISNNSNKEKPLW